MRAPDIPRIEVFDPSWLARAEASGVSWAGEAVFSAGFGAVYLDSLRLWFKEFPAPPRDKRSLRARLESFSTNDHVGAVNELSWWRLMREAGLAATPVPTDRQPRPDFVISGARETFVEVSTLNVSRDEQELLASGEGVPINHSDVLRRLLLKAAGEKAGQILHAAQADCPCWLVIFDYTTWSSLGTARMQVFADALLGPDSMFKRLPTDLSGLVYVERQVIDGRIGISLDRSAAYHNLHATRPTAGLTFGAVPCFTSSAQGEPSQRPEGHWLWL